ncbi:hypothetical protein FSP39_021206 [Pinctada imbricata]|uniref:Uncharacterized protein n=1 Tax=Pinctada imbricata TaxID=66713 RepID=A0AA88XJV5_PINIB|nr:hypothetical protein FSP39_021206 [Pinctada imbricata]
MRYLALRPCTIRYTQDSISSKFSEGSPHSGVQIGQTLDDIVTGHCSITDLPPMTVEMVKGVWYSSNCRRLWVLKKAEELGVCSLVPVKQGFLNESQITTYNFGKNIKVRGDPGGKIWRKVTKLWGKFKKPLKSFGRKVKRSTKGLTKDLTEVSDSSRPYY